MSLAKLVGIHLRTICATTIRDTCEMDSQFHQVVALLCRSEPRHPQWTILVVIPSQHSAVSRFVRDGHAMPEVIQRLPTSFGDMKEHNGLAFCPLLRCCGRLLCITSLTPKRGLVPLFHRARDSVRPVTLKMRTPRIAIPPYITCVCSRPNGVAPNQHEEEKHKWRPSTNCPHGYRGLPPSRAFHCRGSARTEGPMTGAPCNLGMPCSRSTFDGRCLCNHDQGCLFAFPSLIRHTTKTPIN